MMMLALTRAGAQQIVDNLRATVGRRELTLGRSYQRHRAKGPVIVLNSDTVMTNVTGLSFLNVETHARLWDSLLSRDWDQGPHELELDLQSLRARVLAHRLDDQDDAAFAVEILDRKQARPTGRPNRSAPARDPFVVKLQRTAARSTSALAVTGPSGSGKWYVVRERLRAEGHDAPLVLEGGALLGQHSWRLEAARRSPRAGRSCCVGWRIWTSARSARSRPLADAAAPGRLVLTADRVRCAEPALRMLSQVAVGVEVPGLTGRMQELPSIVQALFWPRSNRSSGRCSRPRPCRY